VPLSSPALKDLLSRAFVTFLGDLPAHDMFASHNDATIKLKADKIRSEYPALNPAALRNKALKLLWDGTDQGEWEAKVKVLAEDVGQ